MTVCSELNRSTPDQKYLIVLVYESRRHEMAECIDFTISLLHALAIVVSVNKVELTSVLQSVRIGCIFVEYNSFDTL